jgi:hypothetical protein
MLSSCLPGSQDNIEAAHVVSFIWRDVDLVMLLFDDETDCVCAMITPQRGAGFGGYKGRGREGGCYCLGPGRQQARRRRGAQRGRGQLEVCLALST